MMPASIPLRDGSPDGAAFGEFLRHARERRGLTLQQISHETKIPWRHLDALEHGRLNAVPGGTYRRGEIRAYAEVVGLDKAIALARLDRALESSAPTVVSPPTSAPRSHQQTALAIVAIGVIAFAVAVWLWSRPPTATAARVPAPVLLDASPTVDLASVSRSLLVVEPESPVVAAQISAPVATAARPAEAITVSNQPLATAAVEGLSITSDPPGGRVTVDGIAWGVTPVSIRHLSAGNRRVRVTKEGFAASERVVRLSGERASSTLHIVLQGSPQ
ncbi:MAG: helix-turn-helix domain-containing protein [Vicinamibacterales bacterium]